MIASPARKSRQTRFFLYDERARTVLGVIYPGRHRVVLCRWEDARIVDVRAVAGPGNPRRRLEPVYRNDTDRAWSERYLLQRLIGKRQELLDGRAAASPSGPMIHGLLDEWIGASRGLRAAGTLQWYEAARDRWVAEIGDVPIHTLNAAHTDRFAQALLRADLAPATVRIYFKTLRAFLHWCQRRGHLDRLPPFPSIERDERLPVTLDDDAVARLLDYIRSCREKARAHSRKRLYRLHERFLLAVLATGARRSEIFFLRWEQMDFQAGLVRIQRQRQVFRVKEGREKNVPLQSWAVEWFSQERLQHPDEVYLLDDGRGRLAYADPYQITHALRRHLVKLGIRAKGLKPVHGFRAKLADDLFKQGVDVHTIQRWLGHSKIETTLGYLATPDAHARDAAEKLNAKWQESGSPAPPPKLPN